MNNLTESILKILKRDFFLIVEASGRHVHLSQEASDYLFGKNYEFQIAKPLSQPGQFATKERVDIISNKGTIKNVAILGPQRPETQVEISMTDARILGLTPPIRLSGEINNSPGIILSANGKQLEIKEGVIIAKRHIHLTPETADRLGVKDKQSVRIKTFGSRPLIFDDTIVRVSDKFSDAVHIDYDEANALGFSNSSFAIIQKVNDL